MRARLAMEPESSISGIWIEPDHALGSGVRAITTTRAGGRSAGAFATCNLAEHVGDLPEAVADNRQGLIRATGCSAIQWLNQVHGSRVINATHLSTHTVPDADAAWTNEPGLAVAVLTADCLPVVIADSRGGCVAVAHAGWRGLLEGVLADTVAALPVPAQQCIAWIGPAIGPDAYEVGEDVATATRRLGAIADGALMDGRCTGKYQLDLFLLAQRILLNCGVSRVMCDRVCTYHSDSLFSYRAQAETGRMATLAWLNNPD